MGALEHPAPHDITIAARDHLRLDVTSEPDTTTHISTADLVAPFSLSPLRASLFSLPAGTRTIPRAHSHSSVFIYVLSGSGICWHHGSPYEMGQNDCVGFRAGSGLGWAFINDGNATEPLEFLVFSEEHPEDALAYPSAADGIATPIATWENPPSLPLGKHDGLPASSSTSSLGTPINPSTETFWPSSIFHSLVMGIPNSLPAPDTAEVAPLSILASLTSSSSCHFGVTQTVLPAHSRGPAYGPRAHSHEHRVLYICAALPGGGAKVWLNGDAIELVTGSCIRLQAGTGDAWCVLNESEEELVFLEFAQDVDEDTVFFPLATAKDAETVMRQRALEEFGKNWWEDAPRRKLGSYSADPSLRGASAHA